MTLSHSIGLTCRSSLAGRSDTQQSPSGADLATLEDLRQVCFGQGRVELALRRKGHGQVSIKTKDIFDTLDWYHMSGSWTPGRCIEMSRAPAGKRGGRTGPEWASRRGVSMLLQSRTFTRKPGLPDGGGVFIHHGPPQFLLNRRLELFRIPGTGQLTAASSGSAKGWLCGDLVDRPLSPSRTYGVMDIPGPSSKNI